MPIVQFLAQRKLINPPAFLAGSVQYEVLMGSHAFGVAGDGSDCDVYGFCIPPGQALGAQADVACGQRFECFKALDVLVECAGDGKARSYDFKIYAIDRFFQRCAENNANALEMLFAADKNVLHLTPAARLVRESRRLFLHQGALEQFRDFAFAQLDDMRHRRRQEGKRKQYIERFGYDLKAAYHVVRLLDEAEQILSEGDLDLQRNCAKLRAIREGAWTLDEVVSYFERKDRELAGLCKTSSLRRNPDDARIHELLLACLEMHYGSLSGSAPGVSGPIVTAG